jgi:hypothetical protein
MFFSAVRNAMQAFRRDPEPSEAEKRAMTVLQSAGRDGALGFRKDKKPSSPREIERILSENGIRDAADLAERLAKQDAVREEKALARNRFWVQVVISVVILAAALLFVSPGKPAETTEKALFGLIGTVLGYWLR